MGKRKPEIGEKLFLATKKPYTSKSFGVDCVVTKIGTKYFYVDNKIPFHISDWREKTDYTPYRILYESRQEWKNKLLSAEYHYAIAYTFSYGSNTIYDLSQLKQVAAILNITIEAAEND